ncbi:MAG: glycosyltransferase family 39 protein [Candidatus Heimdallarchaeota archaeon]|nr:MAG: glycosyltransferase family 39 protein [Candidatus Heimdallarchaeota archaeon]
MTSIEKEPDPTESPSLFLRILPYLEKIWNIVIQFRFILVIGLLAFWVKVAFIHSTDMWDEGWFTAIASRMAFGPSPSSPFLPLYYPAEGGDTKFFDKPPFAFWAGAFLMIIFGRTTFAAKGIVILGGAGLALIVYFLYSHQLENKSAAVIAGLLVALAHFLTFYSRTAYIDSFVTFMAALVMLAAIRAVDAIFVENNLKKGYILLFLTFILNIFNILTKAWQGILTYPAIAVYLFFRYSERHINLDDLRAIWNDISQHFTFSRKDMKSFQLIIFKNTERLTKFYLTLKRLRIVTQNFLKFKILRVLLLPIIILERFIYFVKTTIEQGIPFPWIVAVVAGVSAFLGAFLTTQLFASSIILAVGASMGCYIVFLRCSNEQEKQLRFDGSITAVVAGYIAGFAGSLVVTIFYSRFEEPLTVIAQALGEEDVFGSGFFSSLFSSDLFSNKVLALLSLEVIAAIFGLILTFTVVFFTSGILLDLFNRTSKFLKVVYHGIDLIPLVLLGGWVGYWFVAILLMGHFLDRNALLITELGWVVVVFLIPLIIFYPVIKNLIAKRLELKTYIRSRDEILTFSNHLFFLSLAIILIIISFYYFVWWVQYLDFNIANETFPWIVRTPGELARDPEKPDPVTYTFLFFTYYISWRYSHATTAGDLPRSLGSAINDYALIVMLPFFLVGLVAFFFTHKRNPALGSALVAWLITVPFVFFPAQFQLNYYYIPLAVPYLAIAAKGIEYIYSSEQWRITVVDKVECFLASTVFYILFTQRYLSSVIVTVINGLFSLLSGSFVLSSFLNDLYSLELGFLLFISAIYLIPFTFLAFRVLKTFPGIIATGFAYIFFLDSWIKSNGFKILYNILFHDLLETILSMDFTWIIDVVEHGAPVATLLGLVLLIIGLYWLRPNVKPQVFILLGLTLSAMLINTSRLAHVNQIFDLRFQESAIYIKNHGGDYNYSTWVVPDAGSQFAMRYYLGFEVEDRSYYNRANHIPFSKNSSDYMDQYYESHNHIKFWVIINTSEHHNTPPYAINYSAAYRWFTAHEYLVCVDDVVGLTPWYKMHLFVNRTWITENNYDVYKLYG